MKKLIVKAEFIAVPFSPEVTGSPAIPEKWVKEIDGVFTEVLAQPKLEDGSNDESYTHHPAVPEVPSIPEVKEVKEWRVIAQTQGNDEELAVWLEGDKFKYPEGYEVEYIDLTEEINFQNKLKEARLEIDKGMKALALFKVRVKDKNLTTSQIAQLFGDEKINKIISTLSTGSLPLAVMLISSYPTDGVIVSEEDKLALIQELV